MEVEGEPVSQLKSLSDWPEEEMLKAFLAWQQTSGAQVPNTLSASGQPLENLLAPPRKFEPIATVVNQVLDGVKWPLRRDVCLSPPKYTVNTSHANKATTRGVFAAPNKPDRPSMLLYRLEEGGFGSGMRLIQFDAVNDPQMCTVLLAPSGAGKTRKLFELLSTNLGYFIPYKRTGDKNDGSIALSAVVSLLKSDSTIDWEKTNPSQSEFIARRERANFAIYCVLIAYTEVLRVWKASDGGNEDPKPSQWLYIQLFPNEFLGTDPFESLATKLYQSCDPKTVFEYDGFRKDFYCVIDEAQMLGKNLQDKFRPIDIQKVKDRRPVLSPFLEGVKKALDRLPIIAGTGLTLSEEWDSVVSQMGNWQRDFIFTDFPLLTYDQVLELLQSFLVQDGLEHAAQWLVGRPRWAAEFITNRVTSNKDIGAYVKWVTTTIEDSPQPRTLLGAFQRVRDKPQESVLAGATIENPYQAALQDAFLLSMGAEPIPHRSPLLLEFGLAFPIATSEDNLTIKFEPLVLETARLLVDKGPTVRHELLRSVSENPSAFGTRFKYVSATALLKSFTSQPLEGHPLLQGIQLPVKFKGHWGSTDATALYGKLAASAKKMEEFYLEHREPILFPDQNAGPDTVLTLKKPSFEGVLTIFIQNKVMKNVQLKDALLTVDPLKLHHMFRGELPQAASHGVEATSGETPWPGVDREREQYLKKLTGPVIRVVVSMLKDFNEEHVRWIPNHHGFQDLLILIDSTNGELVYGEDFKSIRELRG
ncbi:hypothetical protein BASA81_009850 [Batrachochytrium salamandrivorans]|nr:hypothetical protein BASA81_009850 [Batrachochytrium salamandrivorans]